MKKNYFVDAYVKNKSSDFILTYIRMIDEYVPYFKDGKLNYKEKTIEPEHSLRRHIFITNGR
jgi:hypothetical protein